MHQSIAFPICEDMFFIVFHYILFPGFFGLQSPENNIQSIYEPHLQVLNGNICKKHPHVDD